MTGLSWWKRGGFAAGVAAVFGAALAGGARLGRSAESQAPGPQNVYHGSLSCKACHNFVPNSPENPYTYGQGFIKFDEFETWRNKDKHSLAYANLDGPRGREMAARLHVDVTSRDAGCVGCHSAGPAELTDRVNKRTLFDRTEGVSCENCHGPSSRWVSPHIQADFRLEDVAARAKVGMIDLRSPERQAEQCMSCHIGNVREEKVVTHAMYAAGHPPLPSVEVATFGDQIPRHWFLPGERTNAEVLKELGTKAGQKDRTKLAIVGAAVALRTTMNLIADEAQKSETKKAPGQTWPDYARFDCYACHHSLKRDSWRQERGYEGTPGRPVLNEWPLAIVELGIQRLMLDDPAAKSFQVELERHHKAMLEPTNARPFGRREPVSKASREFAAWSDVLVARLSAATYDATVTRRLLRRLVESASRTAPDYDAARHVGWAIEVLIQDLGGGLPRLDEIKPILATFREQLELDLPAGRDKPIEGNLPEALAKASDFDPFRFRDRLTALLGLLPAD